MARRQINIDSLPSNNKMVPNKPSKSAGPLVDPSRVKSRKSSGFASEVRTVGNSLFSEILLPAIKSAVIDFINSGANMLIYGQQANFSRGGFRQRVAYNQPYKPERSRPSRRSSVRIGSREPVLNDFFFQDRGSAELILGEMMNLIADYGWAKVGDLYAFVGEPVNYTHESWGWTNLDGTQVVYSPSGYVIDFPSPEYLNR